MDYFDYLYRVIYRDTDKFGITYYANYFVWFEAARTEYFRALGLPYTECEKKGYYLPVIETCATYFAPSTYDDLVIVRTSVSYLGKSSMRFEYRVLNQTTQKLLATGYSTHAFVNQKLKPIGMPAEVRAKVKIFSLLGTPSSPQKNRASKV